VEISSTCAHPYPTPPPKYKGNLDTTQVHPSTGVRGRRDTHHSTPHRRFFERLHNPSSVMFPLGGPSTTLPPRPVYSREVMGKFLNCADCGKVFRGEPREPCSQLVLQLLAAKHESCCVSSGLLIHASCRRKLTRGNTGPAPSEQQVCRSVSLSYHNLPRWRCVVDSQNSSALVLLSLFRCVESSASHSHEAPT